MRTGTTRLLADHAPEICRSLLGIPVTVLGSPGNRGRTSVRVRAPERTLIVTRRASPGRARLEAGVLRALHARGAPVPRIFAQRGDVLIQEDLGPLRLSEAIVEGPDIEAWLTAALDGLARIHRAGRAAGLERRVAAIGRQRDWRLEFVSMPARLSRRLGLPPPMLDPDALADQLQVRRPALVKWDARPGNAVARADRSVAWFDWEHCGVRDRLDDVAWLLGDEYAGDHPEIEAALLDRALGEFAEGRPDAADYLAVFGVFHICVRLGLILHYKGDGPWWDRQVCIAEDKVGVRPEWADALCAKGARWSARAPLVTSMAPWFETVRATIAAL